MICQFRNVQQAFQFFFQFDEHTKVGDFGDNTLNNRPWLIFLRNVGFPWVGSQLLQAQSNTLAFFVNRNHQALDFVAFLHDFTGVRNLTCPGHIADVQQAIDAFFQFDEGTVIGQIANSSFDLGSFRVFLGDFVPWIGLSLFHTQRDFLLVFVDTQNDNFDFVADVDQFAGMIDPLGPGHFTDVNQAFNPVFQFHEGPVGHHVDNVTNNLGTNRVLGFDQFPGAG